MLSTEACAQTLGCPTRKATLSGHSVKEHNTGMLTRMYCHTARPSVRIQCNLQEQNLQAPHRLRAMGTADAESTRKLETHLGIAGHAEALAVEVSRRGSTADLLRSVRSRSASCKAQQQGFC